MNNLRCAAFASLVLSACIPVASDVGVSGTMVDPATSMAPWDDGELAWAAPGVQVYAGWDQPMFFVDNRWWAWDNGAWMGWGPGGWAWSQPPIVLSTQIRDPWRYRGWGAPGQSRWAGRGWAGGDARVRDHRNGTAPVGRQRDSWGPARGGGMRTSPGAGWSSGRSGGSVIRDHRRR